jgi:GrpB-like predicted nucleotidyltransferase (UPF0157 family)
VLSADAGPLGVRRGAVRLAASDPRWPDLFAAEAQRLVDAVQRAGLAPLQLEHIGSTAVPGLVAKPILDIMAGASTGAAWQPYLDQFVKLGYERRGPQGAADRELLVLGAEEARTHHLNLVVTGGDFWRDHLAFRDRLRAEPALATAYAVLKQDLAQRYASQREAYTAGKLFFIDEALRGSTSRPAG